MSQAIRVWDAPTRLFHWLLVALFAFSWWSAENREMEWHLLSGVALAGLIMFRLIWGVIGGSTARFASFVRGPGKVLAYWRKGADAPKLPGHNPLGGYSVVALLGLLALQVLTGAFATDTDGLDSGPLSFLLDYDQSRAAAEVHELAFNGLMLLIVLHLAAIVFYRVVRKRNLVHPMLSGLDRELDSAEGALVPAGPVAFLVALAVAAGFAWTLSRGFFL